MLFLRTFGSVHIAGDNGLPLSGAAGQRRLLALLSILAVAGTRGIARDKVLGLLWSDVDPERARHRLTQMLYHTRRALGCEDLFVQSGSDLRLDERYVQTDVAMFEGAFSKDRLDAAAALYHGDFLDGFFLPDAAEFEYWSSLQRDRLRDRMVGILERLATASEAEGDRGATVGWRKRLCALDPLSSGAAARLVETLALAGDPAAALRHARVHAEMVRSQLGDEPGPAVAAALERVHRMAETSSAPVAVAAPAEVPRQVEPEPPSPASHVLEQDSDTVLRETEAGVHPSVAKVGTPHSNDESTAGTPRGRRHWRMVVWAAAAAMLMLAGTAFWQHRFAKPALATPVGQSLIVAPFRVTGADPSLAFLREGIVELLSTRLADDDPTTAVDAGAVLASWRAARGGQDDLARDAALRIAYGLGASQLVVGSVVGNSGRLVISASVVDVRQNIVRASAVVDGPADSLLSLVDGLAVRLLAARAGESDRLAHSVSTSAGAVRAYLDGQFRYQRGDYAGALPHYERAVALDSSFALAGLHLALSADQVGDAARRDRGIALAWAHRDALPDADLAFLRAIAGPAYPAASTAAEQVQALEHATLVAPDRADVWREMGARLFRDGAALGVRNAETRASSALQQALSINPADAAARRLLILLNVRTGDAAALSRVTSVAALRDSVGEYGPFLQWRVAIARNERVTLQRIRSGLARLSDANLLAIAMSSQADGVGGQDGDRALRIAALRASPRSVQLEVLLAQHSLALNASDATRALDLTEQLQERQPGAHAHLRLRILDALYGRGDISAGRAAAATLETLTRGAPPATGGSAASRAVHAADICALEQWRLARGTTASAPAVIEELRQSQVPIATPVGTAPLVCAELLDATLAVASGEGDPAARLARLDSLALTPATAGDAGAYAPILIARLHDQLGELDAALAALRRRSYVAGWPRYFAVERAEEQRLVGALRHAGQ